MSHKNLSLTADSEMKEIVTELWEAKKSESERLCDLESRVSKLEEELRNQKSAQENPNVCME